MPVVSAGSAGSVMGPKGLRRVCEGVCEVELKNNGADFILFYGMKSVLFFVGGVGCMDFLGVCFIMIFLH